MQRLVIGVPARNEGATIADLAGALEQGAAMLGEGVLCELVLAYQPGDDDTLARWESHRFRLPNRVLHGPDGDVGKGRNVKRLIGYAGEQGAHLLLVDGDLSSYHPATVSSFGSYGHLVRGGLVLPLWCRPHGEGNSTDFLACPLIFACYGARIRQPLAGQRLLSTGLLDALDHDRLPDDYGIDVALTVQALAADRPVCQVPVPFPDHAAGTNSAEIMGDVARTLLSLGSEDLRVHRGDVDWPDRWWAGQARASPAPRSLLPYLDNASGGRPGGWSSFFDAAPDQVRDVWCQAVVAAFRLVRTGVDPDRLATDLVQPFMAHAEYRRRLDGDLDRSEAYVADLGYQMAALLT
jgi:hypothetical protein